MPPSITTPAPPRPAKKVCVHLAGSAAAGIAARVDHDDVAPAGFDEGAVPVQLTLWILIFGTRCRGSSRFGMHCRGQRRAGGSRGPSPAARGRGSEGRVWPCTGCVSLLSVAEPIFASPSTSAAAAAKCIDLRNGVQNESPRLKESAGSGARILRSSKPSITFLRLR